LAKKNEKSVIKAVNPSTKELVKNYRNCNGQMVQQIAYLKSEIDTLKK